MAVQVSQREEQIELSESARNDGSQTGAESEPAMTRETSIKVVSAAFSFFVAGINDSSLGTLIPYLIRSYDINTAMVSVM